MKHSVVILLFITLLLVVGACSKDKTCGVPYGDGAYVDLSMPDMSPLSVVGGSLTLNRGHKGIFVVRISSAGDFLAFECACPKDHSVAVEPIEGWGSSLLQCPSCKSIFSIYADGTPVEGSATPCSLHEYYTAMDLDGYHLNIY